MCVAVPPRAARRRTRASLGAVTAADYNILINKNPITRGVARSGVPSRNKVVCKEGTGGQGREKNGDEEVCH